ncbi:mitochondrial ribosomal protein L16 [Laetiporus sulphureus 93-53]|uniref:Mitochondrial ribosomal protein L16 n=1 Tax=Laetiporus sulphureus 93-53 TaxID=1314785 RepID=A0A165GM83_9APHY|nr:mitochondrial ribosomal protein L16 [Laetiporus sulphureus 93-53]KZT10544.1 mitochondrial ribosomal protein L16 [Laetiporus sulphureus 93-53]
MLALSSARSLLAACRPSTSIFSYVSRSLAPALPLGFARFRSQFAPRRVKFLKRHKGVVPIPIGGSIKGTTLAFGDFGIRIKENGKRLTAKQLSSAEEAIKRKIKLVKGAKVFMRVFPDIPVCIKANDVLQGNETRMGKGKGTFEFWATRVAPGRVIFEVGGVPIREEVAREALRLGADKLPTVMEFITHDTPPRLGSLVVPAEELAAMPIVPVRAP